MTTMTLYRSPFYSLLDDLFSDMTPYKRENANFTPVTNLKENDDSFLVSAEMPGLTKENIDLQYSDGILTIRGKRENLENTNEKKFHLQERSTCEFRRNLPIPGIESNAIQASYDNGVLNILLPKQESSKPKKIAIYEGKNFVERMSDRLKAIGSK